MSGGKGRKRRHVSGQVSHIKTLDIRREHAFGRVGLHINPFNPPSLNKIIHISATEGRCNRVMDGVDRYAQHTGALPVDIQSELRHIGHPVGPDPHQPLIGRGHTQKLIAGGHQGGMSQPAAVLELKIKTIGHTQFHHRRGRQGINPGIADPGKSGHGPPDHGLDPEIGVITQFPVLQPDKPHTQVLGRPGEIPAHQGQHGINRGRFVFHKISADLIHDLSGLFKS